MKAGIHPTYEKALITCACGRVTETRSTVGELHVEICSHCHPFFTGRQKLVDTAGRVERFMAKYGMEGREEELAAEVSSPDGAVAGPAVDAEQAAAEAEVGEAVETEAHTPRPAEAAGRSDASEPPTDEAEEADEETGAAIDA